MFKKEIVFFMALAFIVTSCGDTMGSIKRGMTGNKTKSTDEFLVKKKDPLILPPDFERLPTPNEQEVMKNEVSDFKKILIKESSSKITSSTSSSTENSILEQIKNK